MNLIEKCLSREYLYNGAIINLRRDKALLPNGAGCHREVVEHPGGVCVAALTPQNELLFVRQYRYPYGEIILELPAGKLSHGESPLACGKRELKEETGAVAKDYHSLGILYPTPGYCDEKIYMYFARVESVTEPSPDEDEFVETVRIPLDEALRMVLSGEICDAKTQTSVMKVYYMLNAGDV